MSREPLSRGHSFAVDLRELANRCEVHVRTVKFAAHLGADRIRRDPHLLFGFLRHADLEL